MMHILPEINLIVNFLILATALVFLIKSPMKSFLHERSETIRKNVEESEKLQQEALNMLKNYETKLSKLNDEIQELFAHAKKEGEKEKLEILTRAERMSDQIIENAKNTATREIARQKDKLQREVMTKVIDEALKSLKEKASEKDHRAFTEQFIQQMEKQSGDIN